MKPSIHRLLTAFTALVSVGAFCRLGASEVTSGVQLSNAQFLGQVGAAKDRIYWACQADACRLRIVFTNGPPIPKVDPRSGKLVPLVTQAWLLKADGSVIPYRGTGSNIGRDMFLFPLEARGEAFAVAVRIDDRLYSWQLAQDAPPER
jgi:hypothetical protein